MYFDMFLPMTCIFMFSLYI